MLAGPNIGWGCGGLGPMPVGGAKEKELQ